MNNITKFILFNQSRPQAVFFSIRVFFHRHKQLFFHRRFRGQQGKGKGPSFVPLYYSIRSRTFRYLFATLHVCMQLCVSVFGVILVCIFPHISPYSVQMRENVDQNNSEYGHFSRSVPDCYSMRFTTLLTNYLID